MKKSVSKILLVLLSIALFNCGSDLKEKGSSKYISEIKEWHNKRINDLKKENGWLNLTGLYWLKQGENKFGADKSNDVIFPEGTAPAFIGSFLLNDSIVTLKVNGGLEV